MVRLADRTSKRMKALGTLLHMLCQVSVSTHVKGFGFLAHTMEVSLIPNLTVWPVTVNLGQRGSRVAMQPEIFTGGSIATGRLLG